VLQQETNPIARSGSCICSTLALTPQEKSISVKGCLACSLGEARVTRAALTKAANAPHRCIRPGSLL
jgi:hypothetical protein